MGHKINPDIFRLGINKKWSFQMRTNRNFLKNLFLFRFLKNLFVNYNTLLFDFNNLRNTKVGDKLIFKGEDQTAKSPFLISNILFSHVYFGLLNGEIHINSYFIDAGFKQQRRKPKLPPNRFVQNSPEYNFWEPNYYKPSLLGKVNIKNSIEKIDYFSAKNQNKLRLVFSSRKFFKLKLKNRVVKKKNTFRLSRDIFFFSRNFQYRHHPRLRKFIALKKFRTIIRTFLFIKKSIKFYGRKILKMLRVGFKLNQVPYKIRRRVKRFLIFRRNLIKQAKERNKKIIRSNILYSFILRRAHIFQTVKKYNNLYFVKAKNKRIRYRYKNANSLKYLRDRRYKHIKYPFYRKRLRPLFKYFTISSGLKLKLLLNRSVVTRVRGLLKIKPLPKSPLTVFNIIDGRKYIFYNNFKNLKTLKYFFRVLKYMRFFGLKKKIFFTQNLIRLLVNFISLINRSVLTKKIFVILQCLIYYSYSLYYFNHTIIQKHFFSRFLFYKSVSKTLFRSVIELTNNKGLYFSVSGQNKYKFNSSLVLNYILIKLGQYFNIHEIINPLSFFIKNLTSIAGYRIVIRGRLTRKERASVIVRAGKRMPLSTVTANVDYSAGFKIMKFGLVGIKVYLLLKPSSLMNLYQFRFNYAKITK